MAFVTRLSAAFVLFLSMLFATAAANTPQRAVLRVLTVTWVSELEPIKLKVCSGFLLKQGMVITAAHCFKQPKRGQIRSCFVEHQPPPSTGKGRLLYALPEHRFLITHISSPYGESRDCVLAGLKGRDGPEPDHDWAVLHVAENEVTNKSINQHVGESFVPVLNNQQALTLSFSGYPRLTKAKRYTISHSPSFQQAYFFETRPLVILSQPNQKGNSGGPLYHAGTNKAYGIISGNVDATVCEKFLGLKRNCGIAVTFKNAALRKKLSKLLNKS